jgi:hypothetical protein
MKQFSKLMLLTLGFGILAGSLSLITSNPAGASSGAAPVNIAQVSVPSVPVSGTVNATQSGTWNVGINGTPTVNLASGASVNVSNPLDSQNNPTPLAMLDATQPYDDGCTVNFNGSKLASCPFHTVPAGKRLVIQEFDATGAIETGLKPLDILMNGVGNGHFFTATFMGTFEGLDHLSTHQETRLYTGANATPSCTVEISGISNSGNYLCRLSGFLVDVP